jgi:hypothetical protein
MSFSLQITYEGKTDIPIESTIYVNYTGVSSTFIYTGISLILRKAFSSGYLLSF